MVLRSFLSSLQLLLATSDIDLACPRGLGSPPSQVGFSTNEKPEGRGGYYTPSVTISTYDLGQPEVLGGDDI